MALLGRFRRYAAMLALVGLVCAALPPLPATAAATTPAASQPVTQAYGEDSVLQRGMIVRLADKSATKVTAVENDHPDLVQGVVVAANDAALTLSSTASDRQVYVAALGRYEVLVSDQNGSIKSGDYIAVSAVDGVGMKADTRQSVVIGRAVTGFSGSSNVIGTVGLKNKEGKAVQVSLGRVTVDLSTTHNPLFYESDSNGLVGLLKNASTSVAGKPVEPTRVYISLVVLILTAAVAGSVLYSGIRSSIVSIGRNPLAQRSIVHGLFQVISVSIIILVIGVTGVYLLLKL